MSDEKGKAVMKPPLEAFDEQLEYDRASKTYTARCADCGKVYSQKKAWWRSKDATLQKLRFEFACCEKCGKWFCEDCFFIDDGKGNSIGICSSCAKERGINGLTIEQFDVVWPAVRSRIMARRAAGLRAMNKEQITVNKEQ